MGKYGINPLALTMAPMSPELARPTTRRRDGRRVRAYAPPIAESVAPGPFREAMSRYGAAVHVITTDGPAGKGGFTATAVCSVSDDPPTLLVCVNRKSQSGPILTANGVFCVNTLGADDEALSNMFAGRTGAAARDASRPGSGERSRPARLC